MKLILHLVWADLRRFRAWVLLISVLVVASDVLGLRVIYQDLSGGEHALREVVDTYAKVSWTITALRWFGAFAFVLLLFQGDRTVGTGSFWLTRPIAGLRLLVAKTLTALAVVVILPSLVALPWWLWCGFSAGHVANATLDALMFGLLLGIPAAFVASLTDSVSRAFMWGMLLLPATVAFGLVSVANQQLQLPLARALGGVPAVLLTFAAVVVAQYVWRSARVSLVLIPVGGLLAAGMTASGWTPLRPSMDWPANHPLGDNVKITVTGATVNVVSGRRARVEIKIAFKAVDVPTGLLLDGVGARQTWTVNDGTFETPGYFDRAINPGWAAAQVLGYRARPRDPETDAWYKALFEEMRARQRQRGIVPKEIGAVENPSFRIDTVLSPADTALIGKSSPGYDAQLRLRLLAPRLVDTGSCDDQHWRAEHGLGLRVDKTIWREHSLSLATVETEPNAVVAVTWSGLPVRIPPASLFVSPASRDTVIGRTYDVAAVTINGVRIAYRFVESDGDYVIRQGKRLPLNTAWFKKATFGRVSFDEVAQFTHEVKVDALTLEQGF